MRRLTLILALLLLIVLPAPAYAAEPCRTDTYHHDGGKSEPYEQELRITATDGCHAYQAVTLVAREAGGKSGAYTLTIGDANQTWESGSTISGPEQVGYCGYAALQQTHLKYRFGFQVPAGTKVNVTYECGG